MALPKPALDSGSCINTSGRYSPSTDSCIATRTTNTYGYTHGYSKLDGQPESYAQTSAYTEASAHTGAETVMAS